MSVDQFIPGKRYVFEESFRFIWTNPNMDASTSDPIAMNNGEHFICIELVSAKSYKHPLRDNINDSVMCKLKILTDYGFCGYSNIWAYEASRVVDI